MSKITAEIQLNFTKKQKRKLFKIMKISDKYLNINTEKDQMKLMEVYVFNNMKII